MSNEAMPVKAFVSQVEKRLAKLSADELRSILHQLAASVLPEERKAFLAKLKPAAEDEDVLEQKLQTDDLLLDIDDLIQEIEESQKRADEYEERYDRDGGGGWGDEDRLGP